MKKRLCLLSLAVGAALFLASAMSFARGHSESDMDKRTFLTESDTVADM